MTMRNERQPWAHKLRCDQAEVASWLILAAGLALAAAFGAAVLGGVIGSLAENVASAAGTDERSIEPTNGAPGDGSPTLPNGPTGPTNGAPGDGSPTLPDGPSGPTNGAPGDGSPTLPDGTGDSDDSDDTSNGCVATVVSSCTEDGECINIFEPLACSSSPVAVEAFTRHRIYEQCSQSSPVFFLCSNGYTALEPFISATFEDAIGASPGDLYLLAARICDSGGPSCATWIRLADLAFENRVVIATTGVLGDIIPTAPGVSCIPAVADGSITGGEAIECAIGVGTGLGLPIPSSGIDDRLDD